MYGYEKLLTEKCSYEHYNEHNKYNEKTYQTPVEIDCFRSFDVSNVKGYEEQNVISKQVIFIGNDFKPHPFDKIDGFEIKQCKPVKGLLAPIIGWEIVV